MRALVEQMPGFVPGGSESEQEQWSSFALHCTGSELCHELTEHLLSR